MPSVVVVGAGISGLAAAAWLDDAVVLESSAEPGGNVRSDVVDGRVLDRAANGWLDNEPRMRELLDHTGLTPRIVQASPSYGTRWIFAEGRMHAAPMGPLEMARTRLLPMSAKLRLLAEPFAPRGPSTQSVGGFVARRLGPAFVDRMVGPMVAGIYGGDPWQLSLRAAFPRMHELEDEHGSLVLAMLRLRRGGAPAGKLQTLPGGAGELTDTLARRLGDRLRCGVTVTGLRRRPEGWLVETSDGAIEAGAVILACPAFAQAAIVRGLDPELAGALDAIPYAPIAVACTAWDRDAFESSPRGFGVLVARDESLGGVLGTVFTSEVFPHEAPPDEVLIRTMIGGAIAPAAARGDDHDLLQRADAAHRAFFGPIRSAARFTRIYRHSRGIPQYSLGHPARVAAIRSREAHHPGLFLAGNHLQGIGVKDCAREGHGAADRARSWLEPGRRSSEQGA